MYSSIMFLKYALVCFLSSTTNSVSPFRVFSAVNEEFSTQLGISAKSHMCFGSILQLILHKLVFLSTVVLLHGKLLVCSD